MNKEQQNEFKVSDNLRHARICVECADDEAHLSQAELRFYIEAQTHAQIAIALQLQQLNGRLLEIQEEIANSTTKLCDRIDALAAFVGG